MPNTVSTKLKIKPKNTLLTLNAPANFKKGLTGFPADVKILSITKAKATAEYNQVHWFVLNKAQLEKELSTVLKLVKPGIILWIYFPKGTSKIQTDLTRDKGWEKLMSKNSQLTWISLISFDDTWSVFGFRQKGEADKKKEAKAKEREIFKWVNPATKEVKLPVELAAAFKKNKKTSDYFHSLAFSHKKEYIEWIVTAKKEDTKAARVKGTMERLTKQWKNPANR